MLRLPKVPEGYKRQWVSCNKCKRVAHYNYIPYALSNPIMVLPCGHGLGQRWGDAVTFIKETQGRQQLEKQLKTDKHKKGKAAK